MYLPLVSNIPLYSKTKLQIIKIHRKLIAKLIKIMLSETVHIICDSDDFIYIGVVSKSNA